MPNFQLINRAATVAAERVPATEEALRAALPDAEEREIRTLVGALALTDGAHCVSPAPASVARGVHPLSGTPVSLRQFKGAGRGWPPSPPASPLDYWRSTWLPRVDDLMSREASTFPVATAAMPDHALWNRADVAAALAHAIDADSGGKVSLLVLSFGSPQAFIAAARKTSDLWSGSYLVSWLAASGLAHLVESLPPEAIIFPSVRSDAIYLALAHARLAGDRAGRTFSLPWMKGSLDRLQQALRRACPTVADRIEGLMGLLASPSLPNRALLAVPAGAVEAVAAKFKEGLQEAWVSICQAAGTRFQRHCQACAQHWSLDADALWKHQTSTFLPIFWGASTWPRDEQELRSWSEEFCELFGTSLPGAIDKVLSRAVDTSPERRIGTLYGLFDSAAEAGLGGAKGARRFAAWQGAPREKDTIVGEREQIGPPGDPNLHAMRNFWTALVDGQGSGAAALPRGTFRQGERLDAVAIIKRLFPLLADLGKFPSTAMVATRRWRETVLELAARHADLNGSLSDLVQSLAQLLPDEPAVADAQGERPRAAGQPTWGARDADWLYPESLDALEHDPEFNPADPKFNRSRSDALERTRRSLVALGKQATQAASLENRAFGPVPKYYALVFLDGDGMGKWLSGQTAPSMGQILGSVWSKEPDERRWRRPLTPTHHSVFSEALGHFTALSRRLVESALGTVIYSGGDDVVALVPSGNALRLVHLLRFAFSGQLGVKHGQYHLQQPVEFDAWEVRPDADGFFDDPGGVLAISPRSYILMGRTATLSGGVVVAHEKESLDRVLRQVRVEEAHAKKGMGRNSLSLAIMKRSGEVLRTGVPFCSTRDQRGESQWEVDHPDTGNGSLRILDASGHLPCDDLAVIASALEDGSITHGFPTRLRQVLQEMGSSPDEHVPRSILEATVQWLATRHVPGGDPEVTRRGHAAMEALRRLVASSRERRERSDPSALTTGALLLWPAALQFLVRGREP